MPYFHFFEIGEWIDNKPDNDYFQAMVRWRADYGNIIRHSDLPYSIIASVCALSLCLCYFCPVVCAGIAIFVALSAEENKNNADRDGALFYSNLSVLCTVLAYLFAAIITLLLVIYIINIAVTT